MRNFFEKHDSIDTAANPFAQGLNFNNPVDSKNMVKNRLDITDMEVLNSNSTNSELEFMEIRMNNLYRVINENPQNLDPVSIEKMKIEWEDLRTKIYNIKNQNNKNYSVKQIDGFKFAIKKVFQIFRQIKIYSPKIKNIMNTFNEINREVDTLVRHSAPIGEEEMKYKMLVDKICEATKLNLKITNEIK